MRADPCEVDPDPTCEKKPDMYPDPTGKKKLVSRSDPRNDTRSNLNFGSGSDLKKNNPDATLKITRIRPNPDSIFKKQKPGPTLE